MAQVVQHNIMALNSYNKLSTNNSALSKNLEKLSSGYKINRAADDAAGLAISEKMRAQITGLEKATSNAQDGISLVQTAEGALTEVHSMLNRMTELATQSANGTYDETDRANLQKEIDSLKDEINRIADETNFNGINLLDGSMGAATTVETIDEVPTDLEAVTLDAVKAEYSIKIDVAMEASDSITIGGVKIEAKATGAASDQIDISKADTAEKQATRMAEILGKNSDFSKKYDVSVDGDTVKVVAKEAGADAKANDIKYAVLKRGTAGTKYGKIDITEDVKGADEKLDGAAEATQAQYKLTLKDTLKDKETFTYNGVVITGADKATAGNVTAGNSLAQQAMDVADILNQDATFSKSYFAEADNKTGEITITAKKAGVDKNATAMTTAPTGTNAGKAAVEEVVKGAAASSVSATTEAAYAKYELKITTAAGNSEKIRYNGFEYTFSSTKNDDAEKDAAELAKAMAEDDTFKDYNITVKNETITFTAKNIGVDKNAENMKANPEIASGSDLAATATEKTKGVDAKTGAAVKAQYEITLDDVLKSGDKITIGGIELECGTGKDIEKTTIAEQTGEIASKLNGNGDFNKYYEAKTDAAGKLIITAKKAGADDNAAKFTTDVVFTNRVAGSEANLTATAAVKGTDAVEGEDLGSNTFSVDFTGKDITTVAGNKLSVNGKTYEFVKAGEAAATEGAITVELEETDNGDDIANALANAIRANDTEVKLGTTNGNKAELVISKENSADEKENLDVTLEGKGLGLQIGDTASQRLTVNVSNMGTKNIGINDIDISTEEGATAAIDVIKAAINSVSSTRADLGAIQNRLEHTITNLETTTENLTNAESGIRDTDMAKEMMAYTQNNVLSQAAQAMLAQANQQPQQVLQLLQ